jgi:hypothetical protein
LCIESHKKELESTNLLRNGTKDANSTYANSAKHAKDCSRHFAALMIANIFGGPDVVDSNSVQWAEQSSAKNRTTLNAALN